MRKTIFIICYLFLITSSCVLGQTTNCQLTIKGIIQDEHDGRPLADAVVQADKPNIEVLTDADGQFTLPNVCPGEVHLLIHHFGCEVVKHFLSIDKDTFLVIKLEHHAEALHEVVVSGEGGSKSIGKQQYQVGEEQSFNATNTTLAKMLSSVPGVSAISSGANISKPIIHGLSGLRIALMNNGIPQEGQNWGADHGTEIDATAFQKMSVIKGSSAIKYGNQALGGAIVLEPELVDKDPHLHGNIHLGYQHNGRTLGTAINLQQFTKNHGAYRLHFAAKHGGDNFTPNYYLRNTGVREQNLSIFWHNDPASRLHVQHYASIFHTTLGILRGAHVGNLSDLTDAIGRDTPLYTLPYYRNTIEAPKQEVSHMLLKTNGKYALTSSKLLLYQIGVQRNIRKEYDIRRSNYEDLPALNLSLWSLFSEASYRIDHAKYSFDVGAQYRANYNTNAFTGITPLLPNYLSHQWSNYYIYKARNKAIDYEIGARYDYRYVGVSYLYQNTPTPAKHHFHTVATNVGLRKNVTQHWKISTDVAFSQRGPDVSELYSNGLHQGIGGIELGDAQLKQETSFKWIVENKIELGERFHGSVGVYAHWFKNYLYLKPTNENRLTIRGAFPVFQYTATDARILGLDVWANYAITDRWTVTSKMAYIRGTNQNTGLGLNQMPPLTINTSSQITLGHIVSGEFSVMLEHVYVGQQNHFDSTEDLLAPPSAYHLWNGSLLSKWKVWNKELKLGIYVQNAANTTYRNYLNRLRYYGEELGRNVGLQCKLSF